MTRRKRFDIEYDSYRCANPKCRHMLGAKHSVGPYPGPEVPAGDIHEVVDASVPPMNLLCTCCGHYTLIWNQATKSPPAAP